MVTVRWGYCLVLFLSLLFFSNLSGASNLLDQGITELEQGRLSAAQTYFREISYKTPDWSAKALALMRYHYLKKDYQEVWRIGQILRRTGHQSLEQRLLEKSAMFREQVCILEVDSTLARFDNLLNVATYRGHNKYSGGPFQFAKSFQAWDEGSHNTSLSSSLTFYLTEIPKAKLLRGKGCSNLRFNLDDDLSSKKNELESIVQYFRGRGELNDLLIVKPQPELLLLAHALELSKALGQKEFVLNDEIKKLNLDILLEIPDSERRFLWSARDALNPWSDSERFYFAKQTILTSNDPATVDWLAQLDLTKISINDRILILEKLVDYEQLSDNSFLLLNLAQSYWVHQDIKKTLQVLRRLLIEAKGQREESIELASLDLAVQIFSELKWNESVLGALQASLPRNMWVSLHSRLLKQAAFRGERARFEQVLKRLHKNIPDQQVELLRTLAYRNLQSFKKILMVESNKHLSRQTLTFLDDLAAAQFDSPPSSIKNLNLFFIQINLFLKKLIENPNEDGEHLQQLIYIFSQTSSDQWLQGNASIRRGIVQAGKVTLKEDKALVCPFKLLIPKTLPFRELIFKPIGIRSNQWILE